LHKPGYFGEHQVYETADFDVQISLSQPVQDLVIAASAPAGQTAESYDYHLVNARNFAWSASHVYKVNSTTVGDTVVTSYYFPTDAWAAEQALLDTAQALELYSELFSPYPYASLSVVEADFLDGMEFSGLYFLSRGFYNLYDGTPQGYLTAIAAHETAHQWWYSQVGNDQALEPWLDEAMCTYSERIFYENIYPDLLNWWWAFRVDYYEPSGVIDGVIYDYNSFRSYRDSVYLHGAQFFEELRNTIGDDPFFTFLRDYANRKANQQATAEEFFTILQEHTSKDLSGLRDKYFTSEGE
jgi:aminopeptidase N